MTPRDYLAAARVPASLAPQSFGLWEITRRRPRTAFEACYIGDAPSYTVLTRWTDATLHLAQGEVVMEDSLTELARHLPIFLAAQGRVLVTGLGLGCVVRGLLASPKVAHVDVVEIDHDILRVVGAEFDGHPRVSLHEGCALTWNFGDRRWNYAWHDLWTDGNPHLQCLHAKLFVRYRDRVDRQGAWAFPRYIARLCRYPLLGQSRCRQRRRIAA